METNLLFIGLDVDDKSFHGFGICPRTAEYFNFVTKPTFGALLNKLQKFKEKGFEINLCYEASYLGFSLCRYLRKNQIHCDVIAPSSIPNPKGPRIKTDRKDSENLANFYLKDFLKIVHIPNEEDEAERDLIRSRGFFVSQTQSLKKHILSICRRANLNYKQEIGMPGALHWTVKHRNWLDSRVKNLEESAFKKNLQYLISQIHQMEEMINVYNFEITQLAESEKYKKKVEALTCYRGIKELTAMTLITEIGDIARFSHPKKLVSYLGLDIIEYSSGGREKKFGITKMGNTYARTCLVEANQYASQSPKVSRWLQKRREGADPQYLEVADRCMKRIYKKSAKLLNRNKNRNKVKVACAREMIGFIWESLNLEAA